MTKKIGALVFLAALSLPLCPSAYAGGTPSGTKITNMATATYSDGGTPVTVTATAPEITVDNKVNLTVVKNSDLTITPGASNQALAFKVTNLGNTTQGYALTSFKSDGIVMDNVRIYRDNGTIPGVWDAGDTLYANATTFGDVVADGFLNVLIVADTPVGAVSGDIADYQLRAQTVDAGTTTLTVATVGANTDGVDVVFADSAGVYSTDVARDGQHSAVGKYTFNVLALNLLKSVVVTWDPTNLAVDPKATPGAKLTYTIRATVTGVGIAAGVKITDPIPDKSTYIPGTLKLNGAALTDLETDLPGGSVDAGFVDGAPLGVTVNLGDMTSASLTQEISFEVTIN